MERLHEQQMATRATSRPAWSPAQFVNILIGLIFVVMGAVALSRTGFNFSPMHHTEVAGLTQSALLALMELVFGIFALAAGATPGADRSLGIFLGLVGFAGGLVLIIQPTAWHDKLFADTSNGVWYAIAGALMLLVGMMAPVYRYRHARRDVVHEDELL